MPLYLVEGYKIPQLRNMSLDERQATEDEWRLYAPFANACFWPLCIAFHNGQEEKFGKLLRSRRSVRGSLQSGHSPGLASFLRLAGRFAA